MTNYETFEVEYLDDVVDICVYFYSPETPAFIHGDPEKSHDREPVEFEYSIMDPEFAHLDVDDSFYYEALNQYETAIGDYYDSRGDYLYDQWKEDQLYDA